MKKLSILVRKLKYRGMINLLAVDLSILIAIATAAFPSPAPNEIQGKSVPLKLSSVSFANGRYSIDTVFVSGNISRNKMVAELSTETLAEKKCVDQIPAFIAAFLDSAIAGGRFRMADAGEEWQSGVMPPFELVYRSVKNCKGISEEIAQIIPANVPQRQMVYFGIGREIALLAFFNKGPYEEVNVFKFKGERITDFWFGDVTDTVTTKQEIIKYLKGFRYRKVRTGGC